MILLFFGRVLASKIVHMSSENVWRDCLSITKYENVLFMKILSSVHFNQTDRASVPVRRDYKIVTSYRAFIPPMGRMPNATLKVGILIAFLLLL